MHPHSEARVLRPPVPDATGHRVLVVDDDPDALGLVREILESAGARVLHRHVGAFGPGVNRGGVARRLMCPISACQGWTVMS